MATVRPKTVVDMKVSGVGETHARTRVTSRDVVGVLDEPQVRGGTNQGLTPTETLISALVGCTNVIGQRIAEKMGLHVEDMQIVADAQFDRRGVMLEEEIAVPFPEVTLTVSCRSNATPEQVEQWQRDLARFCPIAKVIKGSGTRLNEVWNVRPL